MDKKYEKIYEILSQRTIKKWEKELGEISRLDDRLLWDKDISLRKRRSCLILRIQKFMKRRLLEMFDGNEDEVEKFIGYAMRLEEGEDENEDGYGNKKEDWWKE